MKVLVTGACGYVGIPLTNALLNEGHSVIAVDVMWFGNALASHKNLTVIKEDLRNVDAIPMDGVDAIIHLGNVSNDGAAESFIALAWEINTLATHYLIEKAVNSGVKQFIFAGSGSVYGFKEEKDVVEELSLKPFSLYNKTKMIAERVLLAYKDQIALKIIRPAAISGYSPRMRLDMSVHALTYQALSKGKLTVFGGTQTRPHIHVKDMVGMYLHLLNAGDKLCGVFNAGFENLSMNELAQKVTKIVPAEIEVQPSSDLRSYRLCANKILSTGFKPQFTVENAIQEVAEAYKRGDFVAGDNCDNVKTMKKITNLATVSQ